MFEITPFTDLDTDTEEELADAEPDDQTEAERIYWQQIADRAEYWRQLDNADLDNADDEERC